MVYFGLNPYSQDSFHCLTMHVPRVLGCVRMHLSSRISCMNKVLRDRRITYEDRGRICVYRMDSLQRVAGL
jgi:hypothetical protein